MRLRYFRNRGDHGQLLAHEGLRIGGSALKEEIPWFCLCGAGLGELAGEAVNHGDRGGQADQADCAVEALGEAEVGFRDGREVLPDCDVINQFRHLPDPENYKSWFCFDCDYCKCG